MVTDPEKRHVKQRDIIVDAETRKRFIDQCPKKDMKPVSIYLCAHCDSYGGRGLYKSSCSTLSEREIKMLPEPAKQVEFTTRW